MEYEFDTFISVSETFGLFGKFMAIGFILGFINNLIRLMRFTFGIKKLGTGIMDFLFIMFFGLIIFICSVAYGAGNLRLYYIIASLFGFAVNMVIFGKITSAAGRFFNRSCKKTASYIKRKIIVPIGYKIREIYGKTHYIFVEKCQKMYKSLEKNKIHLKNTLHIVYNNNNNTIIGDFSRKGGENRNAIKAKVRKSG